MWSKGRCRDLVRAGCEYPKAGIFGVKQVSGEGRIEHMRRFPHPVRWLFEALGSERWGLDGSWLGERILDPARMSPGAVRLDVWLGDARQTGDLSSDERHG